MMAATKSTYYQLWKSKMDKVKKVDLGAWEWLMAVDAKMWCENAFHITVNVMC